MLTCLRRSKGLRAQCVKAVIGEGTYLASFKSSILPGTSYQLHPTLISLREDEEVPCTSRVAFSTGSTAFGELIWPGASQDESVLFYPHETWLQDQSHTFVTHFWFWQRSHGALVHIPLWELLPSEHQATPAARRALVAYSTTSGDLGLAASVSYLTQTSKVYPQPTTLSAAFSHTFPSRNCI